MIKQLQRRFIKIAMLSFCIVVFLIVGLTNVLNYVRAKKEIEENLSVVLENLDVIQQTEKNWKWNYGRKDTEDNYVYAEDADTKEDIDAILSGVRFFTVTLDAEGNVIRTNTKNTNTVDARRAAEIALDLHRKGKTDGYGKYSRYRAVSSGNDLIYVFVNCKRKLRECNNFLKTSLLSAILELIAVFFPVYFFSRAVVRPVQESVEKQKAFITNAGHEIKTPLTIIDANTDVIELTSGETEWTKSIRNQIRRLTKLTEELVGLAKLQEIEQLTGPQKIQLSDLLQDACEQFETVAKTHGKELGWDLQQNLWVYGDEAMLERLFSILLDNAIKYADEKAGISVSAKRNGKYILVEVRNPADRGSVYPVRRPLWNFIREK